MTLHLIISLTLQK